MSEIDLLSPLDQAIEEFHKLRDDSRRLLEQAQWPNVTPSQEQSSSEQAPAPETPLP